MGNSIIKTKCLVCGGSGMVYKQQGEGVLAGDYQQTIESLRTENKKLKEALDNKQDDRANMNRKHVEKHGENNHKNDVQSMNWFYEIQDMLIKAHAKYPEATLKIEASKILIDLLEIVVKQSYQLQAQENSSMKTIYGVPLIESDDVKTFRVTATFTMESEE